MEYQDTNSVSSMVSKKYAPKQICGALRDLVAFVQVKNRENN